ncbi:MAG TPA: crosslink repair DNA glycosylase YcaQ family protein [Candidatus Dormibacteraeota bacterium]|nr:crosslink repair DNA glycosylase YcaQ family protein [Candidatus Dormibacteraeota bacterium]
MPRTISAEAARRYLVLRHFLAPPRSLPAEPASVMRVFERLGSVQFDPLDIAGRNHDLVLLARVAGYRRQWTDDLLYRERRLYETYNKGLSLVPTSELPWYRVSWDLYSERFGKATFQEHEALVNELLERIRSNGPLTSGDMPARAAIDWFWRPTNQVRAMLEALALAGILGIARRDGNRRVYDLVERLFAAELLAERHPTEEQRTHKLLSRYRAHGLLGPAGSGEVWLGTGPRAADRVAQRQKLVAEGRIVAVQIEGRREVRHIPAEDEHFLDQAEREIGAGEPPGRVPPQVAFLAPLDPLAWDRRLLRDLFGFEYLWEVYVPEAKRRWGYYVLPILYGDRFVGRIEPRVDRKAGVLRVLGLWWEKGINPRRDATLRDALTVALEAHRQFAGVEKVARLPRSSAS